MKNTIKRLSGISITAILLAGTILADAGTIQGFAGTIQGFAGTIQGLFQAFIG